MYFVPKFQQIPVYFQVYFLNFKYSFLSAFSGNDQAEGTICNGQRPVIPAYSSGSGGAVSPSAGPGDQGPRSTEYLAFYNIKNRLKNYLCCAFFCMLLCVL